MRVSERRIVENLNGRVTPTAVHYWIHKPTDLAERKALQQNIEGEENSPKLARDQKFEIQTHEPTSSLNFQRLGSVLSTSDKIKIVKNSCGGSKDVVVRSRILDQYLNRDLDPRLKKLLELGSRTLIQLGLENENYLPDQLGRLLRKYFKAHYVGKRAKDKYLPYKKTVHSCLGYLLQWHANYENRIKPRLKIDPKIVKEISKLVGIPAQRV